MHNTIFTDRNEAGRLLAKRLTAMKLDRPAVFALPRGGVPVAAIVAEALHAPLDLVLVRKIGAPGQPELAIGAVVDGDEPQMVFNESLVAMTGADAAYIEAVGKRELAEIERRREKYLGGRKRPDPKGRDVVVIDDGLATGATALAAVRALKKRGAARVILAVPVAPPDAVTRLGREADEVVCLEQPRDFQAIGQWYLDFHQLEDDEVIRLLDAAAARLAEGGRKNGS